MSLFTTFDHYNTPIGPDGTPYEYFEMLRDEAIADQRPIGWSEAYGGFWVVAGWPESRAIHENTIAFSNVATTFPPYSTPSGRPFMMSGQDEPEHSHYRKMVQTPFSRPRAAKQIDQLREIANLLIDQVAGRDRIDLCNITDQMPGFAFCAVAGLSMSDAPKFHRFVHGMVGGALDPEGAAADMRAMQDYWNALVEERRGKPAEGLLGEIINTQYDGKYLDEGELLDFFTVLLLGGFDNMLRFFGNAFYRLSCDRELRRRLARQPELIPAAVDELFRLDGPA
jgi:cytochrome P450